MADVQQWAMIPDERGDCVPRPFAYAALLARIAVLEAALAGCKALLEDKEAKLAEERGIVDWIAEHLHAIQPGPPFLLSYLPEAHHQSKVISVNTGGVRTDLRAAIKKVMEAGR